MATLIEDGFDFKPVGRPTAFECGEGGRLENEPVLLAEGHAAAETRKAALFRQAGVARSGRDDRLPRLSQALCHPAAGRPRGFMHKEGLKIRDAGLECIVAAQAFAELADI